MKWCNFSWAAGMLLCGCEIFSVSYPAQLILPGFPKEMVGIKWAGWELEWLDFAGGTSRRRIGVGGAARIQVGKEMPVVVTARPLLANEYCVSGCSEGDGNVGYFFRPAGFFMGEGREAEIWNNGELTSRLELNWEDGFGAVFLLELSRAGVEPGVVNMGRLKRAVSKRSKGMPWHLDMRRLADDFTKGKLWVYSFRLKEDVNVNMALPNGIWLGEYMLSEPLVVEEDGWQGIMRVGYYRFIRKGDLMRAAVSVDAGGKVKVFAPEVLEAAAS